MEKVSSSGLEIFNYKSLFEHLEKKYKVVSEFTIDSDGAIKSLYLQDSYMKDLFNFFPERMCIDVSYKCVETGVFMYMILVEDSNAKSVIISIAFTLFDDSESFSWVLNTFKKHNPNWRRVKIILADSEIKCKNVFRNSFPSPYILISFHHALKSFSKSIQEIQHTEDISVEIITVASDLFKNMYFAFNQAEYEIYYQQFMVLPSSIVSYFLETWMPLQEQWRSGLSFFHENIFSSLNDTLKDLDDNLKFFFYENSLNEFIKKMFLILSLKRNAKVEIFQNVTFSQFSTEHCIYKSFTPYSAQFVIENFHLSSEIYIDCNAMSDSYFFDNFGIPVNTTSSVCSCHFFLYTLLPCQHIFAVRRTLGLNMFDETLVDCCWSLKYYQNAIAFLEKDLSTSDMKYSEVERDLSVSTIDSVTVLFQETLSLLLEVPKQVFNSHIKMLNQLGNLWKENKKVQILYSGIEKESFVNPKTSITSTNVPKDISVNNPQMECYVECSNSGSPLPVPFVKVYEALTGTNWNFRSGVLDGKHINYAYLTRVICESKESCLDWLRQMELIPSTMMCPSCNCEMAIKCVPRLSDGAVWVCLNVMENKRNCSRRCSVRQGSWFELTNMTFEQILSFCYMWLHEFSQNQIISESGISAVTFISWNKWCRRVCKEFLLEEDPSGSFKIESCGTELINNWTRLCEDEDIFLKFLQDANIMHRKDSMRHILR